MGRGQRVLMSAALGVVLAGVGVARAADPEIDKLLQGPVGKDWVTNGGNLTNQRYSTLRQIDTSNVKQLKGAWMTRLKGSGFGGKYSRRRVKSSGSAGQVSTRRLPASAAAGTIAGWR